MEPETTADALLSEIRALRKDIAKFLTVAEEINVQIQPTLEALASSPLARMLKLK